MASDQVLWGKIADGEVVVGGNRTMIYCVCVCVCVTMQYVFVCHW